MDLQINTPDKIIRNVVGYGQDLLALNKPEILQQIVPPDALFVVIAEAVERGNAESFVASTLTPTFNAPTLQTSADQGFDGRFFGYFIVAPGKLYIYKSDQAYLTAATSSVTVSMDQGKHVIATGDKKFKLSQLLPVTTAGDTFASQVSGVNGAGPLIHQLKNQGATVSKSSQKSGLIGIIIFILVFVAIAILAATGKK